MKSAIDDDDNTHLTVFVSLWRESRGWRGRKQAGSGEREHDEEEEERSQKKEQLTVIIVMFNQTPAIKLINTLFPVWLRIHWVPLRHCSAL